MKEMARAWCTAALLASLGVAGAATPAPDIDRILDEQTIDEDGASANIKERLQGLRPDTPDAERLDVLLRAAVASIMGTFEAGTLDPERLTPGIALAERDGHAAAAAVMKAWRASPATEEAGTTAARRTQRLAALDDAVREARASGHATALCLALTHQWVRRMDSGRPASDSAPPAFEAAAMGATAPRCAATTLAVLTSGNLTMSREGDGASGTWRLEKDLEYAAQALRLSPPLGFPASASIVITNRGIRLMYGGRLEEALRDCRQGEALARQGNSASKRAIALVCVSDVLRKMSRPREAIAAGREAARLFEVVKDWNAQHFAYRSLAQIYASLPQPDAAAAEAALQGARAALEKSSSKDSDVDRRALAASAEVYALLGNYRKAYEYSQRAAELDAAALGQQQSDAIAELSTQLDLQGKQNEIDQLALREAEARTRRNAFAIGLVLAVLALAAVALLLRRQTQQKQKITALYTQLETLNADRSRFLAAACHDLRQPTYALGLLAEAASAAPQRSAKYLADIRRNTLTLGDMLGELLDLTQLERGDLHTAPGPVELDALLAEAAAQYRSIAERRGLRLQVVPCGRWVFSDPYLLRRMVFNLVSNACKYTDRGGVQLDVVVVDAIARLRIVDTGRGIPADRIEDMLRPYTRLDHGAAEEGLGIGLSVVQRAAQMLGHPLKIDSEVGRGTTVSIDLPLTAAPAPGVAPEAGSDAPVRGLVAIVDDSPEIREALTSLLNEWGIDTVAAGSREALLQALHERGDPTPTLLLTDYQLGAENGLDLVRALRSQPGWAALPAVMITGSVSVEAEDAASAEGVLVLLKPARPARLRQAMARATGARGR